MTTDFLKLLNRAKWWAGAWKRLAKKKRMRTLELFHGLGRAARQLQAANEENKRLREHLKFTVNAAENLYRPDKPLVDGLDPTFYFTLTYKGDLELIKKTEAARAALQEGMERDS